MRCVLLIQAIIAVLGQGQVIGVMAMRKSPTKLLVHAGVFFVLVYVLFFQIKAFSYGFPFDSISWFGVVALTILIIGLGRFLWSHLYMIRG